MSLDNKVCNRLKCEFLYLIETYPHIAFNLHADRPRSNGYFPPIQDRAHGFRHIVLCEPICTMADQWDINVLKQFDSCVTYNKLFIEKYKNEMTFHLMCGHPADGNLFTLDSFLSYDEKVQGVCFLNRSTALRVKTFNKLDIAPRLVKHVYNRIGWGGEHYQGFKGDGIPLSYDTLKLINKYLFRICFESIYDPFWSNGYVTGKIIECFKAKTVAVYLGCYNIEEFVPTELFIDYRQFNFDNAALSKYLLSFSKERYIEMTEAAYEWTKTCRLGSIEDLEVILKQLK